MKKNKYFFATIEVRVGEWETYTNTALSAPSMGAAEKEVSDGYGCQSYEIGDERSAKISLVEIAESDFAVLKKYI
jgi:hypothetical protein